MTFHRSSQVGVFLGALTATLGWSALAAAQTAAIPEAALNTYEPSERGSEWFANESLDFRSHLRPALGVTGDLAHAAYKLRNQDESERSTIIQTQLYLHVGASMVFFERLRVGLSLPVALAQKGNTDTVGGQTFTGPTKGGIGDLRIAADLRLVGAYGDPFTMAIGGRVWAPTGDASRLIGDGKVRVGPRLTFAGDIGAFVYSAGLGFVYRKNEVDIAGHPHGTEATFSAAMGVRVADKKLVLGPEVYGTTVVTESSAVLGAKTTPLTLLIGGHYTAGSVRIGLGGGPGLSKTIGTPEVRGLISIDFVPEVEETVTTTTTTVVTTETVTVSDRDSDGIPDGEDACPTVAGVKTTDPKTNGCPPDRDGDGVADTDDACPDVPGMKTDDPKTNGCPSDGDKDGVFDKDDACPTVPGVKTDDPKTNGCPADRDKDGIVDAEDACPDLAGPKTNDPKTNGCPLARIEAGQVKITEQIKFKTNSAEILGVSQNILDEVAKILKDHPEVKHIRVEGHTDNVGTPQYNKELSRRRAASVVAALVKVGIPKTSLSSEGFGLEKPIADNATEDGRTENRRVEFHIEESATKKPGDK